MKEAHIIVVQKHPLFFSPLEQKKNPGKTREGGFYSMHTHGN